MSVEGREEMSGGRIAETATRERIAEALLELMKKKNIDKITVKDVVDHCNITRQTFYYHYQDMMDVFEWICRKKADEMLRLILGMDEGEKDEGQGLCRQRLPRQHPPVRTGGPAAGCLPGPFHRRHARLLFAACHDILNLPKNQCT